MGGGQFTKIVQTIVEKESQPIKALEQRKQLEEARMKLFQDFKGKFSDFNAKLAEISSFEKLRELKIDLGGAEDLIDISVDKTKAQAGTYQFQIDQIAEKSAVISNHFADPKEANLGVGYIVVETPNGERNEIFIDYPDASLNQIAAKINNVQNGSVQATVIKDIYDEENPYRLMISSKTDGEIHAAEFPQFYFLDGQKDFWIDDDHDARNAFLTIDGFEIDGESNDIPDFIQGVNVHLKGARPDQPFTVRITEDYQKISGKVKAVVEQINQVLEFINKQNQVDEKSDTRSTFTGDTGLQNVEYRLRNLMHEGFPAHWENNGDYSLKFLHDMGVNFQKDGKLTFDENKFNKELEKDFTGIAEAITGEWGFARQIGDVMKNYTRPMTGFLAVRESAIRQKIKGFDKQIADKERILERRVQAVQDQFARLQGTLANMQAQQQYMAANLGGGGGDILGQLLGSVR